MRRLLIPALVAVPLAVFALWSDAPDRSHPTATDQLGSLRPRGGEEAQNWELSRQNYPQGVELPPAINQAVMDWQAQMPDESQYQPPDGQSLRRLALGPWQFVGPAGAPVRGTSRRYTGRVRDLEYRESSGLRVGSASGGLWEYRDGIPACLTDNLVPYAAAFATHPDNDDHIVLGTG